MPATFERERERERQRGSRVEETKERAPGSEESDICFAVQRIRTSSCLTPLVLSVDVFFKLNNTGAGGGGVVQWFLSKVQQCAFEKGM